MKNLALVCALLALLAGAVRAEEPFTAKDAHAAAAAAIDTLVTVNNGIGDHFFHEGQWDLTVEALKRVIVLSPSEVDAYANAAWLLWSTGKTDDALVLYRKMIEVNPTAEAFYVFGMYHFMRQQYAEALPLLQRAVELGLPAPKRNMYGHCLEKLGRNDEALAFWRKLLAETPNDEVIQRQLTDLQKRLTPKDAPAGTKPAGSNTRATTPAP